MTEAEDRLATKTALPTTTIRARSGWASFRLGEVWQYRELLYFFIWRDIKVRYRQSAVGVAWVLLQPIALVVMFTLVLGRVPGLAPEGIPYALFALAGLVPWTLFSQGLSRDANSVVDAANMVQKVYFPRLLLPISGVARLSPGLRHRRTTAVGAGDPRWLLRHSGLAADRAADAPRIVATLGAGLWLSAANVRYRDVKNTVPFLIQMLLFATPIVYSADIVPDELWLVYHLNPMAGAVEGFRWALFGRETRAPSPSGVMSWPSHVLLASGLAYFRRTERTFADVI